MPSQLHEALLKLFSNNPDLAPTLIKLALGTDLPEHSRIQLHSGELTKVQPLELRADLLAVLYDRDERPVLSVVLEVQLARKLEKLLAWPAYSTEARCRYRCPAIVLVVTPSESVALWAAQPIDLGGGNSFTPWVIGPKGIPYVTDLEEARRAPELSVLSVMAHGREINTERLLQVAIAALTASAGLDEGRGVLYYDLIQASLSDGVKKELLAMNPATYEYQSDFAKRYVAQGAAQARLEMLIEMLTESFGPLPESVNKRIEAASIDTLRAMAKRVRSAKSLQDVLDA